MQSWRVGSYELVRRLGEGGMAQVYLARDVRLGREVAVKVLDQRLAERPGFRERFLREARVAAALDHPNIVPLYDFGDSGQMLYLVMPYVSGGSLQDLLRHAPLPVADVVTYGSQMADALDYAHQRNVVHRDVKPANMLRHADGRVMLADFGLAKILSSTSRPVVPRGHPDAGTPEYMAPEQIEGLTDERSDIYALGVVLYLLLTGQLPFTGMTSSVVMEGHLYRLPPEPRRLNPAITPAMQAVVLRALAKHSTDRFQRAGELGAALLAALVAGDAEPLPFEVAGSPIPTSLPPIPPPSASVTGTPLLYQDMAERQSGQFPVVQPDMFRQLPGSAPLPMPRSSRDTMRPRTSRETMRPQVGSMMDAMLGSMPGSMPGAGPAPGYGLESGMNAGIVGQTAPAGGAWRVSAGPVVLPPAQPSVRSRASGVYPSAAGESMGRMPTLSRPIPAVPSMARPSRPLSAPYDAVASAPYDGDDAVPAMLAASPLMPGVGMRVGHERRSERNARLRVWIAVVTVAALIIAICVALLIWLAQHPSGSLFETGWRTVASLVMATALVHP